MKMNRVAFGGVFVALSVATSLGVASVRHDGAWPTSEKNVSLKLDHVPRSDAVRKLAELAGWSVVVHAPEGDAVDVSVKDQPPAKVLDLLLDDRAYVAKRDGALISIDFDGAAESLAAPVPPVPPPSAAAPPPPPPDASDTDAAPTADASAKPTREHPATRGKDRGATGSNVTIEKAEVAHDVAVLGGNVDVFGTVTGDVSVTGGNLHIHEGGWILGDAVVIGGVLDVDDNAQIDGDVSTLGGVIKRGKLASIGGSIESRGDDTSDDDDDDDDDDKHGVPGYHGPDIRIDHDSGKSHTVHGVRSFLSDLGGALAHSAMLFVFGSVLLALASRRMETLRVEAASRPMRSFAVGVVGLLAAIVLFVACCVTLIGIPVAFIGLLLFVFGAYAGVCAVLTVVGQALLRHKTKSPYVHLAVGCAIFMVLGALPFVGGFFVAATSLVGVGVLIATRAAGLVKSKNGSRPVDATYGSSSPV